jgi:hypothetical protein
MHYRTIHGRARTGALLLGLAILLASLTAPVDAQGPTRFRKRIVAFEYATGGVLPIDVNADGRLDIVAAGDEEIAWYERTVGSSFWAKHTIHKQSAESGKLWAPTMVGTDMDGDGDLDLAAALARAGKVAWFENPGAPAQAWTWHLIDALPAAHGLLLEDLNRDGRPELIADGEGAIAWYLIPRDPRPLLPASYTGEPGGRPIWERKYLARSGVTGVPHFLSLSDLDADGDRDLMLASMEGGYLAWWERPADATLLWTRHLVRDRVKGATHLQAADIDGDGKLDLAYSLGHATGAGWLSGPGWTEDHPIDDGWLLGPHGFALADIDGDGDLDAAASAIDNRRTAWFENDGKGRFTRRELDSDQSGFALSAIDIDKDGDIDLIEAGGDSRNVVWYENQRL